MHIAGGKIVSKPTKPAFQIPPLNPEDLAIPW
jgi:hypothetical protein